MELKDLTKDQAIKISRLAYGESKTFTISQDKEITFEYFPVNPDWYEDGYEHVVVTFYAVTFGDTIDKIHVDIYPNLNVSCGYVRPWKVNPEIGYIHTFPLRNQYYIQKNFIEWGFTPKEEE